MKFTEEQAVQMARECGGFRGAYWCAKPNQCDCNEGERKCSNKTKGVYIEQSQLINLVNLAATKAYQAGRNEALVEAEDERKSFGAI